MTNGVPKRPVPPRAVDADPIRHGRLASRGPAATILRVIGIAVAVAIVAGVSIAGIAIWQVTSSISAGVHLTDGNGKAIQPPPNVGAIEGGVNLLLVGTDTRTDQPGFSDSKNLAASSGAGNNDVNMLLHISADHKSATVVSFPRDLIVSIPACPRANGTSAPATTGSMFNASLGRGGLNCVVLTAEKLTGITIPFAAEITFNGVIGMSDAVGGVTVCLATPIKDGHVGLNLPAGSNTLVGPTALAFVRTRYGVADGSDIGRISNQQIFLSALARKLTSGGVLGNPLALYSIAKTAATNMSLSDGLTNPNTMVSIALALKNVGLGNMTFVQYPTVPDPAASGRVLAVQSAASVLNAALIADKPIQLSGTLGKAAVLDPNAPATTAPTPTGSPAPTATAQAGTVVLPSQITGQTAQQQTCSKSD
ncbi:MAG: lytR [Microbacteriaceae bacterium]|nr:lytR [Microbacteriaceae bacterium]